MKLWVDDLRQPPFGFRQARSVNEAIMIIKDYETMYKVSGGKDIYAVELIDLDHDAGDYAKDGGDYIELLKWLELTKRAYPIRIHSMNPVGVENMRNIINRNKWTEIK